MGHQRATIGEATLNNSQIQKRSKLDLYLRTSHCLASLLAPPSLYFHPRRIQTRLSKAEEKEQDRKGRKNWLLLITEGL
jgi:hypothetical protein